MPYQGGGTGVGLAWLNKKSRTNSALFGVSGFQAYFSQRPWIQDQLPMSLRHTQCPGTQ